MAIDTGIPRSRRALLAGGIGGLAALVTAALGRPLPTSATEGDVIHAGDMLTATSVTQLDTAGTTATALKGIGSAGNGVWGRSIAAYGVIGQSTSSTGVFGASATGNGVLGHCDSGFGVRGTADTGDGVLGTSTSGFGVVGESTASVGVEGEATSGVGVRGYAVTGTAVKAYTADPLKGYALHTVGRVRHEKCAGLATIAAGTKSKTVTPGIDLAATSAVVATLQGSAGGTTTVHRCVVDVPSDTFKIYLTATATNDVKVAWHLFG